MTQRLTGPTAGEPKPASRLRRVLLDILLVGAILWMPTQHLLSQARANAVPGPISPAGGDQLFFVGRALFAEEQISQSSTTWIGILRKQLPLDGVYFPFGRFSTGVDMDLSFLTGVLASVVAQALTGPPPPALSYDAAILVAVILDTIAMWLLLSALRVRALFRVVGVLLPFGYPFYRNSADLGHLAFLHYWPMLLSVLAASWVLCASDRRLRAVVLRAAALAGALFLCAYSAPQYAYFLAIALPPLAIVYLLALRLFPQLPRLPDSRLLLRTAVATAAILGALWLLFPLGVNYDDWQSGLVSEARLGARPISDLRMHAIHPDLLFRSGSHFFVGAIIAGFIAAACLRPPFELRELSSRQCWILLGATTIFVAGVALAVAPAIPPARVVLHAINPSARVYSRAVGLAIPLICVLFTFLLDRIAVRPLRWLGVAALLLVVWAVELERPRAFATTPLGQFETDAHRHLAMSPDDGFAVADLTSVSEMAYRAYGPYMTVGMTGRRSGVVLPCADPLFANTFLFYGGKHLIAGTDDRQCVAGHGNGELFQEAQRFADGSALWASRFARPFDLEQLELGAVTEVLPAQKWFPVLARDRGELARPAPRSQAGYRYRWKREQDEGAPIESGPIENECFGNLDQNPVFSYLHRDRLYLLLAGPPLFVALQPLACPGVVTPDRPGDYVFELEVTFGGEVIRERVPIRVSEGPQSLD